MSENYKIVEQLIRKYSFEELKNNQEVLALLKKLDNKNPQMIEDAQKLELLAAALIYSYLKLNDLNGRGGITAKNVAEYFDLKAPAVSSKVFDVECWIDDDYFDVASDDIYEFIDVDRFKVNEMYWDFLESPESEDVKKSIKILKDIIKKDPDYFDPYITLHEYYLENTENKKAFEILSKGYQKAMNLIVKKDRFPDELPWGFMENRHIIRVIFNFANLLWMIGEKDDAMQIYLQLLRSNTNDNIGARYSIIAILEGYESIEHFEEQFVSKGGFGLDAMALNEWFDKKAKKHKKVIGWWLDIVDD